jgi:hypothetical protein
MVDPISLGATALVVAKKVKAAEKAHEVVNRGVNDIGQMMDRNGYAPDSAKKKFNCRECGSPQWVWAGLPYEPICNECCEKKGIIGKVGAEMGAIGHGFVNLFK